MHVCGALPWRNSRRQLDWAIPWAAVRFPVCHTRDQQDVFIHAAWNQNSRSRLFGSDVSVHLITIADPSPMLSQSRRTARWIVAALAFTLPAAHPLLLPAVGAPSHLLWFILTLPVAIASYSFGVRGAAGSLLAASVWVASGELLFGNGYGVGADDTTVIALTTAVGLTGALIAGFSLAARSEHARNREIELQLAQAQKMEAIGRLAGGVAHDFNNLLTVILSTAHVLRESAAPDSEAREDADAIVGAANSAASLTRQLLAFSRRQAQEKRDLDLSAVVTGMEGMLRRLIGEDVTLVVSAAAPVRVRADAGQLEQVLMNLVANARDAMPAGGRIDVRASRQRVTAARASGGLSTGDYALLEVADTGAGMDAATRARVFEPFFTTKPVGKGTGLGLATVFGIVREAGGAIQVASALGKGTCFRVYLPELVAPQASEPRAEVPEAIGAIPAARSILLAEDQPEVRDATRRMLERLGYRVEVADSGRSAARRFDAAPSRIDLLIADLVMPEVGGLQLAEYVGAVRPELPVLLVSGYTDDHAGLQAALAKGYHFLAKPFDSQRLAASVTGALAEPRASAR